MIIQSLLQSKTSTFASTLSSSSHLIYSKFCNQSKPSQTYKVRLKTSLAVQWLRFCAPKAGGLGPSPGWGTRSYMLQIRVRILQ